MIIPPPRAQELQVAAVDRNVAKKASKPTWSAVVAGKVATINGQSAIIVDPRAVMAATSAVSTAQHDQEKVDDACTKAKKKVQDQVGASDDKEKRRAAIAMLSKFCGNLQGVVNTEIIQDVSALAGPEAAKRALESPEESAKAERALFKNDIGLKTTGTKAKKTAENEAEAHALQRMAKTAIKQNQDKANLACKLGLKKARKSKDPKELP